MAEQATVASSQANRGPLLRQTGKNLQTRRIGDSDQLGWSLYGVVRRSNRHYGKMGNLGIVPVPFAGVLPKGRVRFPEGLRHGSIGDFSCVNVHCFDKGRVGLTCRLKSLGRQTERVRKRHVA